MTNVYAGWKLQVALSGSGMAQWGMLDGITRVTYKLSEGTEAKEECGTRYVTVVEGSYGLTGTIERFYTGSGMLSNFLVGDAALTNYTLWIFPNGSGSGSPYIKIEEIKFDEIEMQHRPMANPMSESITFIGTGKVSTGSV